MIEVFVVALVLGIELRVGPGELYRCTDAVARTVALGTGEVTRCVLGPGVFADHLEYFGSPANLEIVGSGPLTVMQGDVAVTGVQWVPYYPQNATGNNATAIYRAILPPALRIKNIQQAFADGDWISEARYPNARLDNVLKESSWGFCGDGTYHGYCKDRPDRWSDLGAQRVDWFGALATLSIGGRYTTYTRTVTSHTKSGFTFNGNLGPGPGSAKANKPGGRYFLSGLLAALDAPGEWFVDENTWTVYVWMPDSAPPGDRLSLRVKDFCVDVSGSTVGLSNLSMHGCTFRVAKCSGSCAIADLNITYPSYHRQIHLRDPKPFADGPPPNTTLLHANDSTVARVSIRYSNSAGIKVVGNNNRLSELLVLDTDWLATLDYPPIELGFGLAIEAKNLTNGSLGMYPRNTEGHNNTLTRATVGRFGDGGVVTSQLSNEISYTHVFSGSLTGRDAACIHADNSRTRCMAKAASPEEVAGCGKFWHHNWVHGCRGKCMRGDDNTINLTMHHNVVYDCGEPETDGMGQSFGVVLKGDHNQFYANTVLRSKNGDVCLPTAAEGPNTHTVVLNNIAHKWAGKGGPDPVSHPDHFAFWGGMATGAVGVSDFVDFERFDFRPAISAAAFIGKGVVHAPQVPVPNGSRVDIGAYQHDDPSPWVPGCTFAPECWLLAPPPAPAPPPATCPPLPGGGWNCSANSYCGPRNSYYWSGQLSLADCAAKCAANATCGCLDHHVAGITIDLTGTGMENPECRLHTSASDVIPAHRGYDAYWKKPAASIVSLATSRRRAAEKENNGDSQVSKTHPGNPESSQECSPSFPSDKCDWTTSCVKGQPFWNTPYQGTSCTWRFTPGSNSAAGPRHPLLKASFRTAYAVNVSVFDGGSDASPRLAFFEGKEHPGVDDGTISAEGTGIELTVRLDAEPAGGTFGLMFSFDITEQ